MADKPVTPAAADWQPISNWQVHAAWEAYAATQKCAAANTELLDNEFFTALQDTAYARFLLLWDAA